MKEIEQKVKEMIEASSSCADLKAAGQAWLDAEGTDKEADATAALLAEIEEDVTPIDGLIAFAGSEAGAKVFGEKMAADLLAHAKEIKANGALYCDCPGCSAALAVKKLLKP